LSDEVDWKEIAKGLAASNERLCRIALAADELAAAVPADGTSLTWVEARALKKALENYKITRNGQ
jgi:hypothetical protein